MAHNYSYDQLPTIQESQDIAEYLDTAWYSNISQGTLNVSRDPSLISSFSSSQQNDTPDPSNLNSHNTRNSSSSSVEKTKKGWGKGIDLIRRQPLTRYMKPSVRNHPAEDIEPARIKRGVWKDQFLVDRSLRGMALLTTLFAVAMLAVVCVYARDFGNRVNKFSSSIGGKTMDCNKVTRTNTFLLLAINLGATMQLGMSNTYQQLVTSLKIGDLKHMLEKFGDSRVGTNSPFNINHMQSGKRKSWAAWILLVLTSIPIHFLANSLTGPSYIFEPPKFVEYRPVTMDDPDTTIYGYITDLSDGIGTSLVFKDNSFVCWSAFKTGRAHIPESRRLLLQDDELALSDAGWSGLSFSKITVAYARGNCSGLANTTSDVTVLESETLSKFNATETVVMQEGNCISSVGMACALSDVVPAKCRLNVRLNAAFVLTVALAIKAIYMIVVNVMARGRLKRQLLTFGDVIVASASHRELRIQGECMVNANEIYRRRNTHSCHTHCKNPTGSKTGDETGHCQKCKKFNDTNRLHNESQPTISTKIKRTLISNLGTTALAQMCIMLFCSIVLVGGSLAVAIPLGTHMAYIDHNCDQLNSQDAQYDPAIEAQYYKSVICPLSKSQRLVMTSGGWGGFNSSISIADMPADQLKNEFLTFCISNGAQFIYSLLYLLLIYNITLICQEYDWGTLEHRRKRLRCTIVKGESFKQDYLLQIPKKILFPVMMYSVATHWMLGEALQTQEKVWMDNKPELNRYVEHSKYVITYAAYPLWTATVLILIMTGVCWWAFTYRREGFIPQMFGSIRTLCSATTQLDDFPSNGIMWGDLGMGKQYRNAGLSHEEVMNIVPYELYAGTGDDDAEEDEVREESMPLLRNERRPGEHQDAGDTR